MGNTVRYMKPRRLSLNEYQKLASRTANLEEAGLTNFALGLTGEAGEVADIVKKYVYHGHPMSNVDFKKELGDVLWYVSQLANWAGISLEDVAITNIKKLEERYPDGFSEEASRSRKE